MVSSWLISYCHNSLFIVYMAKCSYVVVDFAQASITLFKQHGLFFGSCYQGHRSEINAPDCGCQRFLWLNLKEYDPPYHPTHAPSTRYRMRANFPNHPFPCDSNLTCVFQCIHWMYILFHRYMSLPSLFWCAHNGKRTNSYIWNLNIVIQNSIDKELCNMWLFRQLINVSLCEIGNECKEPSHRLY